MPCPAFEITCGLAAEVGAVFQGRSTVVLPKSLLVCWEMKSLWRAMSLCSDRGLGGQAPWRSCFTEHKQCWGPMKCTRIYFRFFPSGPDFWEGTLGFHFTPLSSGGCLAFGESPSPPHLTYQCSPWTGVRCWLCVFPYLAARFKVYWS